MSHRDTIIESFSGAFSSIEFEEDIRETDEERELRLKEFENDIKSSKMESWYKLMYYLATGDVTKIESVVKTNANLIFAHLQFEKANKKWVQSVKA